MSMQLPEFVHDRGREADGGFCAPQQKSCDILGNQDFDSSVEVLGELSGIFLGLLGTVVVTFYLMVSGLNRSPDRILKPEKQSSTWSVCSRSICKSAM